MLFELCQGTCNWLSSGTLWLLSMCEWVSDMIMHAEWNSLNKPTVVIKITSSDIYHGMSNCKEKIA